MLYVCMLLHVYVYVFNNQINLNQRTNHRHTGNASQLSDGASACVLMEEQEAVRLGLEPLGAFMG